MEIISHRANSVSAWSQAKSNGWGIEVDLRTYKGRVYLSHDFIEGENALEYTPSFSMLFEFTKNNWDGTVVLDCKEAGIVQRLFGIHSYKHYVCTDLLVPDEIFIKGVGMRTLTRKSRFENINIGVDCEPQYKAALYHEYWVDYVYSVEDLKQYQINALQSFVVSPELHKYKPRYDDDFLIQEIRIQVCKLTDEFINAVYDMGFKGVCTHEPERYAEHA